MLPTRSRLCRYARFKKATFVIFLISLLYLWYFYTNYERQYYKLALQYAVETISDSCELPHIDPYDPTILKYIHPVNPLQCSVLQEEFTTLINGFIIFLKPPTSLSCQYRCFSRASENDDNLDYGPWKFLQNNTQTTCQFIETGCWKKFPPLRIYSNLHSQIVPLSEVLQRKQPKKLPSVLLFVVDSISNSNWRRNLPKTMDVLTNLYNATIFSGFTKVGDNSFPNAAAFLTGKRVQTAGYPSELPDDMTQDYFDAWPIIWKDYAAAGAATFYAEDYPSFNLFRYLAKGFKDPPTDHYFRPVWLQLYGSLLHRRSTHLCYGNRKCHNIQLDYLEQFLTAYSSKKPTFGLHWLTELGHDYLNQVGVGDDDISMFFEKMRSKLADSFVFVFADHGHRFDPIRQTVIGRIEERMPFFSMALPQNLRNTKIQSIVKENADKLTSFWDLYITLKDILDTNFESDFDESPFDFRRHSPRGLSLLRPLPHRRNCSAAGIPEEFCTCQREKSVSITDPNVESSAIAIIKKVNTLLAPVRKKCAILRLSEIKHAQTFAPPQHLTQSFFGTTGFSVNFRVALEAQPSGAFFEGTVRFDLSQTEKFTVIGDINRINTYGNQSTCVQTQLLRKYCFCID